METVRKNAGAGASNEVIILIALAVFVAIGLTFVNNQTPSANEMAPAIAVPETVKIWNMASPEEVEVSTTSLKNVGASILLVQSEIAGEYYAISDLLAPGQVMPLASGTKTVWVTIPDQSKVWPNSARHDPNDIWITGTNYYLSFIYSR